METSETSLEETISVRRSNKPSEETITYASILRANLQKSTNTKSPEPKNLTTTNYRRKHINILYKHKKDNEKSNNTKPTTTETKPKKTQNNTQIENMVPEEQDVELEMTTNESTATTTSEITLEEFNKLKTYVQQKTKQIEQLLKQIQEQSQLYQKIKSSIQDIQQNLSKLAETSVKQQSYTTSVTTQPTDSENKTENVTT